MWIKALVDHTMSGWDVPTEPILSSIEDVRREDRELTELTHCHAIFLDSEPSRTLLVVAGIIVVVTCSLVVNSEMFASSTIHSGFFNASCINIDHWMSLEWTAYWWVTACVNISQYSSLRSHSVFFPLQSGFPIDILIITHVGMLTNTSMWQHGAPAQLVV